MNRFVAITNHLDEPLRWKRMVACKVPLSRRHFFKLSNMRLLFLIIAILFVQFASAQLSVGGGLGMSSKGDIAKLQLQYEFKRIGISAGYLAHMDNENPVYFTSEIFAPLRIDQNFRMVPHAGYSFKMKSDDNKELNNGCFIYGMDLEHGMNYRAVVVFGFSRVIDHHTNTSYIYDNEGVFKNKVTTYTKESPLFFSIGLRYVFGQLPNCY